MNPYMWTLMLFIVSPFNVPWVCNVYLWLRCVVKELAKIDLQTRRMGQIWLPQKIPGDLFFGRKEDFAWPTQERPIRRLFKPWSTVYFINELAYWYSCWFITAIILTHYKLKAEGVKQCLMSGTTQLTSDVLRQLLAFAPDDQEVTAV